MTQRTVGILLFNEVEVLDFAGPFEVFSITALSDSQKPFVVTTISQTGEMISARNGLKVTPDYSFENHPPIDILIVPGGYGAEEIEIHNPAVIQWIQEQTSKAEFTASVCTGAFLLAKAGILDGKEVTTHWMDIDLLEKEYPSVLVVRDVKFVDQGSLITSAGISAGIHMSLHLISRIYGKDIANQTAKRMEYDITIE
ncbi:DJ-1/PfpI family protein [Paenibacillus durus]|uniref:AraC family transcriptional regulator n=1 Tax=Paenibacillus durus TaxID=44251 RepID=A0A089ITN1_PAEDU|nr:DJ-1/PfpI family protein [Paenibacillus durus]AIQ12344.1 AraC family transcriptional regulator [Paenibacillus durus]